MKLNKLASSLPPASELGLGTMTFGAETDEPEAWRQLDMYVAAGGNFIDTADVYGGGESERIIGRWLADRSPDGIVLATKGRFAPPAGHSGASRRALEIALERSLERLGVDSVDLYYVHGWDPDTAVEETLGFLTEAAAAGKIGAVGWSNTTAWQLQRILDAARRHGFVEPIIFQPQYNLLDRNIEIELMPLCLEEGVGLAPWSPLGGGWRRGVHNPKHGQGLVDHRHSRLDRTGGRSLDRSSGTALAAIKAGGHIDPVGGSHHRAARTESLHRRLPTWRGSNRSTHRRFSSWTPALSVWDGGEIHGYDRVAGTRDASVGPDTRCPLVIPNVLGLPTQQMTRSVEIRGTFLGQAASSDAIALAFSICSPFM
jgi:aryl-alcohol dehydrogenase-like predicted oxidoreductase